MRLKSNHTHSLHPYCKNCIYHSQTYIEEICLQADDTDQESELQKAIIKNHICIYFVEKENSLITY